MKLALFGRKRFIFTQIDGGWDEDDDVDVGLLRAPGVHDRHGGDDADRDDRGAGEAARAADASAALQRLRRRRVDLQRNENLQARDITTRNDPGCAGLKKKNND